MIFIAQSNIDVTVIPTIVGAGAPPIAQFVLNKVASNGVITPLPAGGGGFVVPGNAIGTIAALLLYTTPGFLPNGSGDVLVTATQNGNPIANGLPMPGKSPDWLCTVTQVGGLHQEPLSVYFKF